ncbi:hypothetical protein [Microcoleus sp. herbarium12]|jgi:hypothetical protein|uniref:hypothetical protein n=1 Tax=Microcoleus sp. herbarium12 TaxID=3055437 RepID=UPI002FCFC7E4
MAQSLKQLHAQVQAMPSDSVKAIVLSWLNLSNGNLSDLERLIAEIAEESEGYQWGEIDTENQFQPLGEEQTIAMSLSVLEDYQKSKTGISGDRVKEWADSLGSDVLANCANIKLQIKVNHSS